jgi:WD repeat-containing protein 54
VINVPHGGEGITFFDSLETKESPISTLGSSIVLVAAGNDNGDIYGFDPNSAFERVCRFVGSGFPCTSLVVKDDYIFAAFMNGKLRLYRVSPVQEMSVEISAHARTINAVCVHPSQYLAASVGDDQILHVWSLPDYSAGSYTSAEVNLFCSNQIENKKLTGVAFLSDDRIGVVAYDDDELTIFSRN